MKIRPSTQLQQDGAANGQSWRYNSTTGKYESFTPADQIYVARDRLTASTGNNTLTLGASPVTNSPVIWVNGTLKWPGTDYTISDNIITFGSTLTAGDIVEDYYTTTNASAGAAALSSPAATLPPVTSGLVVFFDAAQMTLSDGASVTSWTDVTSTALVTTNTGTAPIFHTGRTPNGKPTVVFNNSDRMSSGNVLLGLGNGVTIATVVKRASLTDYDSWASKVSGSNNFDTWGRSDGLVQFQWDSGLIINAASAWNDTSFHRILVAAGNSGDQGAWIYIDGTSVASNGTAVAGMESNSPLYLGGRSDDVTDLNGEIACVAIWDRKLTSTERSSVDSWLSTRY